MSLKLESVDNANTPEEEFVWLKATSKISLKGYAIVDRTFADEKISNEFRHIFFFPDIEVEKDDWIRLCTGEGTYRKVKSKSTNYIHYLYWQSAECVWNDNGGDTASLIKYTLVESVKVPPVKK